MGFAWHKLLPRRVSGNTSECPPPPVCNLPDETFNLCVDVCPPDPNGGPNPCSIFCENTSIGGPACGEQPILIGGDKNNPGKPLELRLNAPLYCWITSDNTSSVGICDYEYRTGVVQSYYYRTPNSPSSTPAQITGGSVCFKYNAYSVPDRAMVISGRNRYKYFGWGADPSCDGTIPALWDTAGGSGIKQNELSISGRSWPAENSVLNLPLFGAIVSDNPFNPDPCSNGSCQSQTCFGVRDNDEIGHYSSSSLGNGKGYYSFQCFNPQAYHSPDNQNFVPVPTCSVWSMVHALWYTFHGGFESDAISNYPSVKNALDALFTVDPSGSTAGGVQNVRYYLEQFADGLSASVGWNFIYPNVFLWDRTSFNNAANNTDKWKHIYVIGNANVLFDTHCTRNCSDPADPIVKFGHVFHLDEVSHDPEYGSTGNARFIQWFGCDPTNGGNAGSVAYTEMNTLNCVPSNPKGGTQNYCADCQNEGANGDTTVQQMTCNYKGYSPNVPYNWLTGESC